MKNGYLCGDMNDTDKIAAELFGRVAQILGMTDGAMANKLMHETLVQVCHEGLAGSNLAFGNLFSQVDFLCKKHHVAWPTPSPSSACAVKPTAPDDPRRMTCATTAVRWPCSSRPFSAWMCRGRSSAAFPTPTGRTRICSPWTIVACVASCGKPTPTASPPPSTRTPTRGRWP